MRKYLLVGLSLFILGCASFAEFERFNPAELSNIVKQHQGIDYRPTPGDSHEKYIPALYVIAKRLHYEVKDYQFVDSTMGAQHAGYKVILLKEGLKGNAKFEVFVHELAHAMQPLALNRQDSEIFAEAVCWCVAKGLGLDNGYQAGTYLSKANEIVLHRAVFRWANIIDRTCVVLVNTIEKETSETEN